MRDYSARDLGGIYPTGVGQWDYSFVGGGEPFEYIWIMATDYDAAGLLYNPDAGGVDLMDELAGSGPGAVNAYFTLWFGPRGSRDFLSDDGVLTLVPNKVNSTSDIFSFTTTAPTLFNIAKGDVNGDASVDVADVLLIVNFILGTNLFTGEQEYASDFNSDLTINIADVVTTIRSILGLSKGLAKTTEKGIVHLSIGEKADVIGRSISFPVKLDADRQVSGIQFEFEFDPLLVNPLPPVLEGDSWNGISVIHNSANEGEVIYLFYGMGGKIIPDFDEVTFRFETVAESPDSPAEITLISAVIAGADGSPVKVEFGNTTTTTAAIPNTFALHNNYPNPFNPVTTISYDVPVSGPITLRIYNLLGQVVRELVNEEVSPGAYKITWNGRNDAGRALSSGIYFARLNAKGYVSTQKMILLK